MDEATSHLDVMNEIRIGEQIKQFAMTRVIVAHRPETIKQADRVLVMHMGNFIPLNLYSSKERKARSVTWYLGSLDLLHGKSCLSQKARSRFAADRAFERPLDEFIKQTQLRILM
ncbi:hypothetical protein [Shewanella indica]|uniref:hypothetical protein n=1 Tax=Shewanella indica TaxID=768528 RepID=UPI003CC7A32C